MGTRYVALSCVASGALLLQRIDCEVRSFSSSWACYLVFKDRAACTACDLCATVAALGCGLIQPRGRIIYSRPLFLSSGLLLSAFSPPPVLRGFLPRGGGFYFPADLPVNRAVSGLDSFVVRRTDLLPRSRGRGFYHHRVGCQPEGRPPYFGFQPQTHWEARARRCRSREAVDTAPL